MSAPRKLEANHSSGSPPNVRKLLNSSEAMKQGDQRSISHAECHDEVNHQIGAQTANIQQNNNIMIQKNIERHTAHITVT